MEKRVRGIMDIEIKEDGNKVTASQKNGGTLIFEKLENDLIKTTFLNMRGVPGKWTAPAWLIDAMLFKTKANTVKNANQALKLAYDEMAKEISEHYKGSEMAGRLDMLQQYFNKLADLIK